MNNTSIDVHRLARLFQFAAVQLNALLALLPLKLNTNSVSSVSWNG